MNDSFMLYNCLQLHGILRAIATLIQAAPGVYKNEMKKKINKFQQLFFLHRIIKTMNIITKVSLYVYF